MDIEFYVLFFESVYEGLIGTSPTQLDDLLNRQGNPSQYIPLLQLLIRINPLPRYEFHCVHVILKMRVDMLQILYYRINPLVYDR